MKHFDVSRLVSIFILLLFWGHLVHGQSCHNTLMSRDLDRLEKINRSFDYLYAIEVADSLILELESLRLDSCKVYFQIKIAKGESLEYFFHNNDALILYYSILTKMQKLGYYKLCIETYLSMARLYEANEKPEYCKEKLDLALAMMKESGFYDSYGRYSIRLSSYHRLHGIQDSALHYADIALKLSKNDDSNRTERDAYLLLGMLTKDTDKSIEYSKKAIELFVNNKSYYGAASQNYNIGKKLRINGRSEESLIYFSQAIQNINQLSKDDISSIHLLQAIYDQKKEYFLDIDNIDSAYFYTLLSHKYEKEATLKEEEDLIDSIAMQQVIRHEAQKVEFLEVQKRQLQLGLIGGGLLLLTVSVLLLRIIRNRKMIREKNALIGDKNKALEASNSQKSMLLSEIHHRVKNNLQLIISLLVLQGEKSTDNNTKQELQNISNKVRSIALIHDHLCRSGEFDRIELVDYYHDMFNNFYQLKPFNYHIECNKIRLNVETLMPLGIISAELIANSLKYAEVDSLNLYLTIREINDGYELVFKDNGQGYEGDLFMKSSDKMGALLIQSMVRQLNGSFSTYNDKGAVFVVNFKEKIVSKI